MHRFSTKPETPRSTSVRRGRISITGPRIVSVRYGYHQQYLAKPGSRPYCSAQPCGVALGDFAAAHYKLPASVWQHYDWTVSHCVLRGDNAPIQLR